MPLDRASVAEECVRQGVYIGVEPHYLLAVAQLRSGISSDDDGERKGLFRLTQAEWDANSNDDDLDIHFTPVQISSPLRQCAVFAVMTSRAFNAFAKANNRNPSTKELYLQQFPGADTTNLQRALDDTAALIGPAADAVLDEPQAVSTLPAPDKPTPGPPNITPDPIPPAPGAPGAPGATLTLAMLQRHWRRADPALIQGMLATAGVLGRLGINTPLRMAHFMGQITQESGGGTEMTEKLSYSAERMMEVFPRRFPTLASTQGFVRNERAFGNKVYNGRMGNRPGSDDGFDFRGRGCLQLTGRHSYDAVGRSLTLNLVDNPDLVNDPKNVLLIAATEFVKLGCLPECDRDNVVQVSARINLGHPTSSPGAINGLAERKRQIGLWKQEFGV
ncbi:MAG TPA: glycoside hydrolase family 19 protein [Xanthobacteraceae bacterium]|nr:glycoside hydrolase family 19 protein [Xanthobacteraceae bacterium]